MGTTLPSNLSKQTQRSHLYLIYAAFSNIFYSSFSAKSVEFRRKIMLSSRIIVSIMLLCCVAAAVPGKSAGQAERRQRVDSANIRVLRYKSKMFLAVGEKQTWNNARSACKVMGGDLAVITTIKEQDFLISALATAFPGVSAGTEFHIGGRFQNGEWKWVSGEKITYDAGFKSNHISASDIANSNPGEKCFSMHSSSTGFCFLGCSDSMPFVCEM